MNHFDVIDGYDMRLDIPDSSSRSVSLFTQLRALDTNLARILLRLTKEKVPNAVSQGPCSIRMIEAKVVILG